MVSKLDKSCPFTSSDHSCSWKWLSPLGVTTRPLLTGALCPWVCLFPPCSPFVHSSWLTSMTPADSAQTKHDLPCFLPSWALHLYILHHLCLSTFSKGQGHHLIYHCGSYSAATCRERGHNDSRTALPCSDPSLRGIPNSRRATNVWHWDAIPKALLTQNDMRIQTNLQVPPLSFNTIQ